MTTDQKIIKTKAGLLELEVEDAVLGLATEQPAWGQVRMANELQKRGSAP